MKKRITFLILCLSVLCLLLQAQNEIPLDESTLDLLGVWAGGSTYSVEMQNGISYCGVGHYFKIFNFEDDPFVEYGQLELNTTILDIEVQGSYAYVANDTAGLTIIDISNADSPVQIAHYHNTSHFYSAHDVCIEGSYAYLAYGGLGLKIIDISDPVNPIEVGNCTSTTACYSVDVSGDLAYITDFYGKLYVIDVSDHGNPVELGVFDNSGIYYEHIAMNGNYACIAGGTEGLRILNVENQDSIYEAGYYDTPGQAVNITVENNYAFVSDLDGGMIVFDISTPETLTPDQIFNTEGCVRDVSVEGDSILLADESNGILAICGLSNDSLTKYACYNPGDRLTGISVSDSEDQVFVSDHRYGMYTLNVQDKEQPRQTGSLFLGIEAANCVVHTDNYAYVGDDDKNLYIVDISSGSSQSILNIDTLSGVPIAMYISGSNLFITMELQGMAIYDISDPLEPAYLSNIETEGSAKNIEVQGSYAYVADGSSGFYMINITDPQNLIITEHVSSKSSAKDIAVNGNYVYTAEYAQGLRVYDISDTSNVAVVDSFYTGSYALFVDVCDNFVSVIFENKYSYKQSLLLFDVTDPLNIQLAYTRELSSLSAVKDLKMTSGYLYVPFYVAGLYIYSYEIPITDVIARSLPDRIELMQNYPNPFNPTTRIEFDIPIATEVTLSLYNIVGQKISTLINEHKEAGHYGLVFNAGSLSSGLYFYHLTAGEQSYARKMCVVK